jgi:hypothetical protein
MRAHTPHKCSHITHTPHTYTRHTLHTRARTHTKH